MKRDVSLLATTDFDLIVIGAGITGAFLAHDAASRGLKVAVIDQGDFGAATSSASSKLLHGGIRYLQEGRLNKVRESAMERIYYQIIAPHLTRYIPFVVPAQKGFAKGLFLLICGMIAYSITCLGQNRFLKDKVKRVPGWRLVAASGMRSRIPGYDANNGKGGVEFFESHMHSSERMTLAVLQTAAANGAAVVNYVRFTEYVIDKNRVVGIYASDLVSGDKIKINCAFVINASGPWIPKINSQLSQRDGSSSDLLTGYSVGAHLVTKKLTNDCAIALATKSKNQAMISRGGRHVFIIPWRDSSLIGTSYRSYNGALDDVRTSDEDIDELLDSVNSALGQQVISRADVKYTFAGIYPLIDDVDPSVYQGTGNYQVVDHRDDGLDGVLTVFGAKFTTARLLSERALDSIKDRFEVRMKPCSTRTSPSTNGGIDDLAGFQRVCRERYSSHLSDRIVDSLICSYGLAIDEVMKIALANEHLLERVADNRDVIQAEVLYAARNEMVVSLSDFVFRRTGLGTLGDPGEQAIERCAALLGEELKWDESRKRSETQKVMEVFMYFNESHGSLRGVNS